MIGRVAHAPIAGFERRGDAASHEIGYRSTQRVARGSMVRIPISE
jgi:hypothetical protein